MSAHPWVWSVRHPPKYIAERELDQTRKELSRGCQEVERRLREHTEQHGPGTLFLEGSSDRTDGWKTKTTLFTPQLLEEELNDPQFHAAQVARKLGWKVRSLDKKSISEVLRKRQNSRRPLEEIPETDWYIAYDLREKRWTGILNREAKENDLVVIHPAHVDGLASRMNLDPNRVVWIHEYNGESYPRPNPKKLEEEMRERKKGRRTD